MNEVPIVVPYWLHQNPDLKMPEAVLLADIYSLHTKGDGCHASSKWFADRYHLSTKRIDEMLASLRKREFLVSIQRGGRRWLELLGAPPGNGESEKATTRKRVGALPGNGGRLYNNKEENKEAAAGATGPSTGFGLVKGKANDSSHAARLARRFEKKARLHRLLVNRQRPNFVKWKQAATDLLESTKAKRIAQVMDWYFENFRDDQWLPTARSMTTFAEKFIAIEKAMRREDGGENSGFTTVTERELGNGETEVRIQYNE